MRGSSDDDSSALLPGSNYDEATTRDEYAAEEIRLRDLTRAGFGGHFPRDKRFRILFSWSVSSFLVGLVMLFFAWMWVVALFGPGFQGILRASAVVDSNTSLGYQDYVTSPGASKDIPPFLELWWLFNVTNAEDVARKGHLPVVTNHGPYVYTMVKSKQNISWSDDGNVISFRECQSWLWAPELSRQYGCVDCDPDRDTIVNVNPGYMGAIAQAGGELPLVQAFTGPAMARVFAFLTAVFVPDMVALNSSGALPARQAVVERNQSLSADAFYAVWANATSPPAAVWSGMLVSAGQAQPSNISLAAAQALFDPEAPYSLASKQPAAYELWAAAAARHNRTALAFAAATFGLSAAQAQLLADWLRTQFWPQWVVPPLLVQYSVPSVELLAYVQWGEGTVSPLASPKKGAKHLSVQALYPQQHFGAKPEFALWSDNAGTMPWQDALLLWGDIAHPLAGNRLGLFNAGNWALFALYAAVPANATALRDVWGIDDATQLRLLELYFADMADKFAQPDMAALASAGGGLVTARPVSSWAWRAVDPLLLALQPRSADVALQPNISNEAECRRVAVDAYYTGKDKLGQVGETITYGGMTQWPVGWYNTSYPPYVVHGVNSEGQFAPNLPSGRPLYAFDNNFMRTLRLDHIANVTVKGVQAYRYTLSLDNFAAPNYRFSVNTPDLQGFCNVSGPQQGAPVFLSQAYMYGAHKKYVDKIHGMPVPDPDADPTFVDVEPYTGKAIQTSQALQVNLHNPCNPNWFLLSPFDNAPPCDIMFPLAVIRQYSVLNHYNSHQIVGQLYLALRLEKIIYACFLGLGLGAVALSAFLAWLGIRRLRHLRRSTVVDMEHNAINY